MGKFKFFYADHKKLLMIIVLAVWLALAISFLVEKTSERVEFASFPNIHCVGSEQTFQCQKRHFAYLTKTLGPKLAMDDLKHLYGWSGEVISDCHQITHVIGNTAVDLYQGNIAQAFIFGDSFCWSGYYHGAVEQAVKEVGRERFVDTANVMCAAIPGKDRYSFDYYNCVHGLGHGLMSVTDNQLFDSLALCTKLTGSWEQLSCEGGVFMENIMVDNRNQHTDFLKPDDLMYPCDAVDVTFKGQCYLMQTSYALSKTGYDFKNAFKLCANVDVDFRDTCAQSIGRDASGYSVSNPERTRDTCALGLDDNQTKNCLIGAVKDFISYFHGAGQAERLCSILAPRFQEGCQQTASAYVTTL